MRFLFSGFLLLLCCATVQAQHNNDFSKEIKKHRKQYKKDFLQDTRSPLDKKDLKNLDFYSPDTAFRVVATFERTENPESFEMPTYSGITKPYIKYGTARFVLNGQEYQLAVYRSLNTIRIPMYRDYLFIPFKDFTNGETTYGGGRYMDMKTGDIQDGTLVIDFNKAYNPWCAYSDGYNCPIPPDENHLEVEITAGERAYLGEPKKR